jgi:polygalacturonase
MKDASRVCMLVLWSVLTMAFPCWARVWDVTELGARGDKEADDTAAIQKAIDSAFQAGGGTAYLPAGNYRCAQLQLRSNVTVHIEAGATLWVSPEKEDYPSGNRFLFARGAENLTITGRGAIHGTGEKDLQRRRGDTQPRPDWRVGILDLRECTNVTIRDVTVRYSDSWTFDLERCQNVVIDGVRILNNYYRVNADGIDPVSCRSVRISNCHIVAGDDCIVCKTREGFPCEDIVVTNCVLESIATAVKIGTESPSDFRDILVSNCVIRNSTVGIGMYIKDGATAERISFSNCTIETIRRPELANESLENSVFPIFVDIEKRRKESKIGSIRDLNFSDIAIVSDNGVLIQGMNKSKIENLSLRNITLRVDRAFDYSERKKHVGGTTQETEDRRRTIYARQPSYFTLANIDGLAVVALRVLIPDDVFARHNRSALSLHAVSKAVVGDIRREPAGAGSDVPVVMMEDCRNALLTGCFALPNTGIFLGLAGKETANISLSGSDPGAARKPVLLSEEVPKDAIRD